MIITCRSCNGTGEEFKPGVAGDGWRDRKCWNCEGSGELHKTNDTTFPIISSATGVTFRDDKGRFRSLKEADDE